MSLVAGSRLSDVCEGRESIELELPIQVPSRPSTPSTPAAPLIPIIDLNTGIMDEAVERHLLSLAQELGIDIPPEPGSLRQDDIEVASANVSALTVSSAQDTNTIPSRTSQSTRPTSANSSVKNDQLLQTPQPMYPARRPSRTFRRQASAPSVAESTASSSSKFLKGFRRLSSFTKRRSSVVSPGESPSSGRVSFDSVGMYFGQELPRPETAGTIVLPDPSEFRDLSPNIATGRGLLRRTLSNVSITSSIGAMSLPDKTSYAPIAARPDRAFAAAERAKRRTLQNPRLQSLRLRQLDEQTQFLNYHTSLLEGVRARSAKEITTTKASFDERRETLEDNHTEVQAALEDRHLAAEMELSRSLAQERQACDTKLKHMDAYCNGRLSVLASASGKGGATTKAPSYPPRRKVTDEDYRKLVQQYHLRQGMDNLHEARINVLRKKQGNQVERVCDRQQIELEAFDKTFDAEIRRRRAAAGREEHDLRADFDVKKDRLSWRWKLMETVERAKLEMESGLTYGEMPDVQWGDHELLRPAARGV